LLLLAWKVKKKHFFFLLLVKLRFFNFYLFIYFCMKIFNSWILCLLLLY
jgi:hypothetical protein